MSSPEHDARQAITAWLTETMDAHSWDVYVSPDTGKLDVEVLDPLEFAGAMMDDWQKLAGMVRPALQARRDAASPPTEAGTGGS